MILLDSPCVSNPPVFQTRSCKPWTTHYGFNFDPQTSPPKPSFTAPLEPSWAIDRRLHCRVARVACADRWAPNHRGYSCSNPPQKAGWARINGEKTGMAFDTTRIDPKKDGIWETAINIPSAKIPIWMNQLSVLSEVLYQGFSWGICTSLVPYLSLSQSSKGSYIWPSLCFAQQPEFFVKLWLPFDRLQKHLITWTTSRIATQLDQVHLWLYSKFSTNVLHFGQAVLTGLKPVSISILTSPKHPQPQDFFWRLTSWWRLLQQL